MFRLLRSSFGLGRKVNFPILPSSSSRSWSSSSPSIQFKKMSRLNVLDCSHPSVMKMNYFSTAQPPLNSNEEKENTEKTYDFAVNFTHFMLALHSFIVIIGKVIIFWPRSCKAECDITIEIHQLPHLNVPPPLMFCAAKTEEPEPTNSTNTFSALPLLPKPGRDKCKTIDCEQPEKKESATTSPIIIISSPQITINNHNYYNNCAQNNALNSTKFMLKILIPLLNFFFLGIKWKLILEVNSLRFVSIAIWMIIVLLE